MDWQAGAADLISLATVSRWSGNLTGGPEAERVGCAYVSPSFFDLLGVAPAAGRGLREQDEEDSASGPGSVVVSDGLAQRLFGGSARALGQVVRINYRAFRILGVAPRGFAFPDDATEVWMKSDLVPRARAYHHLLVVGRLKTGRSIAQAQTAITIAAARLAADFPDSNAGRGVRLVPLREQTVGRTRQSLLLVFAAVGFVLLLSCVNAANLMLCRGLHRRREMAVRAALGAGRRRIVQSILIESTVLSAISGAGGCLAAGLALPLIVSLAPSNLPRLNDVSVDRLVLWFAVGLSALVGLVCGLVPAMDAARVTLVEAMRHGSTGSVGDRNRRALQKMFVVVQVAATVLLLASTGMLTRSLINVLRVDPGFNPSRVLTLQLTLPAGKYAPLELPAFYDRLFERLRALPSVTAVSSVDPLPLADGESFAPVTASDAATGGQSNAIDTASVRVVGPDYCRTMSVPLLAGREIGPLDTLDTPRVAMVSASLAKLLWPALRTPTGQRLRVLQPDGTSATVAEVVGIVGDIRGDRLERESAPTAYLAVAQQFAFPTVLLRTSGDPLGMMEVVRQSVKAIDPDVPTFHVRSMQNIVDSSLSGRRFGTQLLAVLAAIGFLVAAVGVFAAWSHLVETRAKEVGLRLALGASPARIVRLIAREAIAVVWIGVAFGTAAAVATMRTTRAWLYGVDAIDPVTLTLVALGLSCVGLVAAYLPARRASVLDPTVTIRTE